MTGPCVICSRSRALLHHILDRRKHLTNNPAFMAPGSMLHKSTRGEVGSHNARYPAQPRDAGSPESDQIRRPTAMRTYTSSSRDARSTALREALKPWET